MAHLEGMAQMTLPELVAERDRHLHRMSELKAELWDEQQIVNHLEAEITAESQRAAYEAAKGMDLDSGPAGDESGEVAG